MIGKESMFVLVLGSILEGDSTFVRGKGSAAGER
jgi:hypothetical protein